MWDLQTIIRLNNEAWRAFKKKDSASKGEQKEAGGNEGVFDTKDRVFRETSYLRSVYEGEVNRCAPQGGTGETLP